MTQNPREELEVAILWTLAHDMPKENRVDCIRDALDTYTAEILNHVSADVYAALDTLIVPVVEDDSKQQENNRLVNEAWRLANAAIRKHKGV